MGKKLTGAIVTVAAVGIIGAAAGGMGAEPEVDGLYPPLKYNQCDGVHYEEIAQDFTDAGFTDISYDIIDDLVLGWFTKDGDVESVTINGDTEFDTKSLYPYDASVVISYHTFPSDDTETPETTKIVVDLGTEPPITETTALITETTAPETEPPKPVTEAPKPVTEAPAPVTEAPKPVTQAPTPTTEAPKPVAQAPAVQESLKITSVTSPVGGGQNATLTAIGKPNTEYSIKVVYSSGASTAKGLEAKKSNGSGAVSWTWKVGAKTKPGTYTITVTGGGESQKIQFTVT